MKPRDYCCCALPIIDAGVYATLTEQFVLGIVVGTLSLATPSIVGAVTPTMAPWILAIVSFIASGIQGLGFIGVAKEKPITFRRYLTLHILTTTAAFSIALVWIIMSATRHSTAQSRCVSRFFPSAPDTPTSSDGQVICNIFPWVQVGVMGGLWIILASVQFYLYLVLSSYKSRQQHDHAMFGSDYDPTHPLTSDIPMMDRHQSWDAGADKPYSASRGYGHVRQESVTSVTDDQYHRRGASYSSAGYGEYDHKGPNNSRGQSLRANSHLDHPVGAHTADPGPTPMFSESYYTGGNGVASDVNRPLPSRPHPAEGSFHRKTPKASTQRTNSR